MWLTALLPSCLISVLYVWRYLCRHIEGVNLVSASSSLSALRGYHRPTEAAARAVKAECDALAPRGTWDL